MVGFIHRRMAHRHSSFRCRLTQLAARKLIDMDPDKPNMAKGFFVDRAIEDAASSSNESMRVGLRL
jgi:hypothetical protein